MTDAQHSPGPAQIHSPLDLISQYLHPGKENVMLIYVLYLAGLVPAFGIVPIIVGFVMALINRPNGTGVWASHYQFQVRTFPIGLAYVIGSAFLMVVVIGIGLLVLALVWWIVRSVKGLIAASHNQEIARPLAWGW